MKKLLFLLSTVAMFIACSSDDPVTGGGNADNNEIGTEVYAMGKQLSASGTRSTTSSLAGAKASKEGKYENGWFFIRIDGRIPKDVGMFPANEYWPYDGNSVFKKENQGTVDTSYPYWKRYSNNGWQSTGQYVYDSEGTDVMKVLGDIPSFESMMSVNRRDQEDIAKIDTTNLKIIWYVAKFTYGKWHVDGVLTYDYVKDVNDIPGIEGEPSLDNNADEPSRVLGNEGNVEVDIHQQQHTDWQEIKTSVHVRDLVDKVTIEIPLEFENIAEVDDFAIRSYDLNLGDKVFINGTEYALDSSNPVKVTIEHKADKMVITIQCTDAKYLAALRKEYSDGVTVEVHTYPKNLTKEEVWTRLQKATVKTTPATYERLIFNGATSAFFSE